MQAPTLSDDGVAVRPLGPADLDALVEQSRDPLVRRWTSVPEPYERRDAEAYLRDVVRPGWESGRELVLAVERDCRYAGLVRLRPDDAGGAGVGYVLGPWARGAGTMSTALRLVLVWAFAEMDLEVVHWRALVGNWPARRVAWACGFTVEGVVRRLATHQGARADCWVGSVVREDPMRPTTRWLDVPEIRGGQVVLRRHRVDDAVRVAEACSAPSTQRWLPELPSPYTVLDAASYLLSREEEHASGRGLYWAIADPVDDRLLGALGLMRIDQRFRSGEIGYWVHSDSRGAGVATAATLAAARHALLPAQDGGLGLARVLLRVAEGNAASRRVAERAGFTLVGRDRQAELLRDGSSTDFLRYDLLPAELPPAR